MKLYNAGFLGLALFFFFLALFDILFGLGVFGEEPYCGILCGMDLMEPPKEAADVPEQQ